jgi:hypothetical protein
MDITSKNTRATLKGYFVRNAIPTQSNFEDLIDSLINQADDGIVKLPGKPLSLQPDVSDTELNTVLNFYKNLAEAEPSWTLSLNPRTDIGDAQTAQSGWSLGDKDGMSRLFIDETTGNIGIGTTSPKVKLEVKGDLKAESGSFDKLEVKGYIEATKFIGDGSGLTSINTSQLTGPFEKLEVNGIAVISNGHSYATNKNFMAAGSLTVGSINKDYGGGKKWNENTAGLLLETRNNTEIAVHDSGKRLASLMYYVGNAANRIIIGRDMGWGAIKEVVLNGNVGIGTTSPSAKLEVKGNIKAESGRLETLEVNVLHLGRKWRLSGTGDRKANDEWLRLYDIKDSEYYGGLAAGKLYTSKGALSGSDSRLKTEITTLVQPLANVLKLRGVQFKWRDMERSNSDSSYEIGLIAQEVEESFPSLVSDGPDGMKSVNYAAIVAPLIEAIKEQQVQIDELRANVLASKSQSEVTGNV